MSEDLAPPRSEVEEPTERIPLVFLSYSHDSKDHKQWVAAFATKLVENGIQVLFDQWDLNFGDDVPKFMERGVAAVDRVLMVCTEEYVRKANDGKGGVGYEAMIVTGELVRDLGSNKFIPVVRQTGSEATLPRCVSTRLYINLGDGDRYDEEFEKLLRELHQAPLLAKPALGRNPFSSESFFVKAVDPLQTANVEDCAEPSKVYEKALQIIGDKNTLAWRKLLRSTNTLSVASLRDWRGDGSSIPRFDENAPEEFFAHAEAGVACYAPFIACLLAAAESRVPGFADQTGWIDAILSPEGWERSGPVYWVEFPDAILFVTQALVGGLLMEVGEGRLAYQIGVSKVGDVYHPQEKMAIFSRSNITGWPESLTRQCTKAWGFLDRLIGSWSWLHEVFGSPEKCRMAITGYYLLLNFLNFVKISKDGHLEKDDLSFPLRVPLTFCRWGQAICDDGYRLFLAQHDLLEELIAANGISELGRFEALWALWVEKNGKWLGSVYPWHRANDLAFPHQNLPEDLKRGKKWVL